MVEQSAIVFSDFFFPLSLSLYIYASPFQRKFSVHNINKMRVGVGVSWVPYMPAGTVVAVSFIAETFIQINIITTTDFPARLQLKFESISWFGFETKDQAASW